MYVQMPGKRGMDGPLVVCEVCRNETYRISEENGAPWNDGVKVAGSQLVFAG